jgi:4-oxalocrotonate tautomerase
MPFVRITVFGPSLDPQQLRHLQQGATDLMTSIMRKPLEGTSILIERIEQGGWTIAGKPIEVAAHVDAVIGAGTNTSEEKSAFMEGMMELLRSALGPRLREETYVVVHELAHDSYGRGGLTRTARERQEVSRASSFSPRWQPLAIREP